MRFSLGRLLTRLFAPARPRRRARPRIEVLEERYLPTAYTVTTVKDALNDTAKGQVTLRDVLTALNTGSASGNAPAPSDSNSVAFAIGRPGSLQTITLNTNLGALPAINRQVVINVLTQGGSSYTGAPLIVLNGAGSGTTDSGLDFELGSSGSVVEGLVIQRFGGAGVLLHATSDITVQDNYIGTNSAGLASAIAYGNRVAGVLIGGGATNNTIGGTTVNGRNVISGNSGDGVALEDAGTSGNVVLGNLIGTNVHGTGKLANGFDGVDIEGAASDNTIGGTAPGAGNVISGNGWEGVEIGKTFLAGKGTASGNVVEGNRIGTDVSGTVKLGNGGEGVLLDDNAGSNTIGGTSAGAGNLISGNNGDGVALGFDPSDPANTSAGTLVWANAIQGNLIGTDVSGLANLDNAGGGVRIVDGASGNTVGGTLAGSGNTIAFNLGGVVIGNSPTDAGTINDSVLGNSIFSNVRIGIDLGNDGMTANPTTFPNDGQNAPVLSSVSGSSVSGRLTTAPGTYRVELFASPTSGSLLQGQTFLTFTTVSVPAAGTQTFSVSGLTISPGMTVTASATNLANGDTSEFGTLLTTNYVVTTNKDLLGDKTPGEVTLRDAITAIDTGLASGNAPAPSVQNTISFTIGKPGSVQTITLNAALGALPMILREVNIVGFSQAGDTAAYSGPPLIVLNGASAGPNASGLHFALDSDGSVVTGLNIEHFTASGILLDFVQHVVVQGNRIGTDRTGMRSAGNGLNGVLIEDSAANNTIGGATVVARNILSGNGGNGIEIIGGGTSGNVVEGNYIGTNASGTTALPNKSNGVLIANGAQANLIGTADGGARNLVSGNTGAGISLFGLGTSNNVVAGNFIGTSLTGRTALPNVMAGVMIASGAANNTVGGTVFGSGNTIAFNAKAVVIGSSYFDAGTVGDSILGNSIVSVGGPGIDLVTTSDNNGQSAPVVTHMTVSSVSGTLTTKKGTYRIEFFASPRGSVRQGKTFLGFTMVTLSADGSQEFTADMAMPAGMTITATATNLATGDTSELS